MQRKITLLGGVAVCAIASFGLVAAASAGAPAKHHKHHAAASAPMGEGKVEALTAEVETLENRLTAESQAREALQGQVQAAQAQAAQAQADAQAAHQQLAEQIQTIPGEVKADVAAAQPHDGKAHYKGVTLTVGGFAAAESVYRSKQEEADIGSNFAKIPFANTVSGHTSEERFTARQSRLSLLAEGDISPDTKAAFYSEFDFLAGPQTANSNEVQLVQPAYPQRLRHLGCGQHSMPCWPELVADDDELQGHHAAQRSFAGRPSKHSTSRASSGRANPSCGSPAISPTSRSGPPSRWKTRRPPSLPPPPAPPAPRCPA